MTIITAPVICRLVANLYRHHPDDHVLSIGDWSDEFFDPPVFHASVQLTVGDFRRWAAELGEKTMQYDPNQF